MDSSPTQKALDSSNEVTITVTGRKTGRQYSTPVWFVRDGKTVFLLPGGGSRSQWYRNAIKLERIKISSGRVSLDLTAAPITDLKTLGTVVEKFRKKYGLTYYSDSKRFDVALALTLP
jgi:deazaflavin-dependent oxidoreductase (nitroreductase family)